MNSTTCRLHSTLDFNTRLLHSNSVERFDLQTEKKEKKKKKKQKKNVARDQHISEDEDSFSIV